VKAKEVAFTKMMADAIKSGQAKGVFRQGDPELIVNAILGMLIWVYQWYRPERHLEADIDETFWQLFSGGLMLRSNVGTDRKSASESARSRPRSRRPNGKSAR